MACVDVANFEVNVLGENYKVLIKDKRIDDDLKDRQGYCDFSGKLIVLQEEKEDLKKYREDLLRHELVHAFLYESGLDCSSWGRNEEIVDWIAIQLPKITKAFETTKGILKIKE